MQPTYDEMLPSDLAMLESTESPHTLALWYRALNTDKWPEELAPCAAPYRGSHEGWKALAPDRRDDIMEWIRNRVGAKYLLMVWQCEMMLANIAPWMSKSEADFEEWWNEQSPRDPSSTKGEDHLRSAQWWAKTREEWRAARKVRQ